MKHSQHLRLIYLSIAIFLVLFEMAATPAIISAQASDWNAPIAISSAQTTAWFPDIATDSTGRVHVAWASGSTGFDTVVYTWTNDGTFWAPINDIAAIPQNGTESYATRPDLSVGQNGVLNLSYVAITLFYSKAAALNARAATAWSNAEKLNSDQVAYYSRIIQDNQGQMHLFYTENVISNGCSQCYHLFHRVSTNNGATWSAAVDVSADGTGSGKPNVAADSKGNLFAAWESGTGGGLGQLNDPTIAKFKASHDGGKTWDPEVILSQPSGKIAKNVALGIDDHGNLLAVWLSLPENKVDYSFSSDSGKTWSTPAAIDSVVGGWNAYPTKNDDYSLVTDSNGRIHLFMVGQLDQSQKPTQQPTTTPRRTQPAATQSPTQSPTPSQGSIALTLFHFTFQAGSWSQPEAVANFSGDVPEWPRAAISNGNILNVVWFVRDQADIWNSDNAHYRIWYSRKVTDAPAVPTVMPVIPPTSTPGTLDTVGTTPTALPNSSPLVNLVPTLEPFEKTPSNAPSTENDYVGILGKALAPSAVLVLISGLIFYFRRRR